METVKVEYKASVLVDAGFRSVDIVAIVELNSTGKKGTVIEVLTIDGETPAFKMSRTGANRQSYNGFRVVERELGNVKIISKCVVIK